MEKKYRMSEIDIIKNCCFMSYGWRCMEFEEALESEIKGKNIINIRESETPFGSISPSDVLRILENVDEEIPENVIKRIVEEYTLDEAFKMCIFENLVYIGNTISDHFISDEEQLGWYLIEDLYKEEWDKIPQSFQCHIDVEGWGRDFILNGSCDLLGEGWVYFR